MSGIDLSEYDGSQPLGNARWEKFAQNVANGMSFASAYAIAGFKAATRNSLDANASNLAKKPEVARRIAWLKIRNVSGAPLTKEEKIGILESIIKTGSDSDKLRAMAAHSEMCGDKEELVLDPATICEYLSSHAGERKHFGPGLRKIISWCGVGIDEVKAEVAKIEAELAAKAGTP